MLWKLQVYLNQLLLRQEEVFDKANTKKASTGQGLRVLEAKQSRSIFDRQLLLSFDKWLLVSGYQQRLCRSLGLGSY